MSDQAPQCAGCEDASSTLFCEDCAAYYCSACDATAHSIRNARNHIRVSSNAMLQGHVNFCSGHKSKRADLFCNDCKDAICLLCREYGQHADHNVDLIENSAQQLRDTLKEQVDKVNSITTMAKETLGKVDVTLNELNADRGQTAKEAINNHFESILKALGERRNELLQNVDVLAEAKQRRLLEQIDSIKSSVASGNEQLEEVRTFCQMDDFTVCDGYSRTMDALAKLKKTSPDHEIPVVDSTIPIAFDSVFLDVIRHHAAVGGPMRVRFSSATKGVCSVEWDEPLKSDNRSWASYHVKARMLTSPSEANVADGSWVKVGGVFEKNLGSVPASQHEVTVVVSEYPGAVMTFLVMAVDTAGRSTAWSVSPQRLRLPDSFMHRTFEPSATPFSKNDLFYYLGTNGGNQEYTNPHLSGEVSVTSSSIGGGCLEQFVNADAGADFCYTDDKADSWMCVDIGANRLFRPAAYSLRHDQQGPRGVLRNWVLQGKVHEYDDWKAISVHQDDGSLRCLAGSVASFSLDPGGTDGYRYFRILQTGKNSSQKNRLLCGGFELFGTLF